MDVLTFVAELIKALAWPVALCVLIFALRTNFAAILKRLTSLKYSDTELRFAEDVDRARETLDAKEPATAPTPNKPISDIESRVLKLLEVSPVAGLMEAWRLLEGAMREKAKALAIESKQDGPLPFHSVLSTIRDSGKIDDGDAKIILKMREWRNASAHSAGDYVDTATAWTYASMALQFKKKIDL